MEGKRIFVFGPISGNGEYGTIVDVRSKDNPFVVQMDDTKPGVYVYLKREHFKFVNDAPLSPHEALARITEVVDSVNALDKIKEILKQVKR